MVLTVQFIQAFVKRVNEVLMPVEKCFFLLILFDVVTVFGLIS